MLELKTVLCPIDFSPLAEREVALAAEVCQAFGARLVLHHDVADAFPGMVKKWEWEGSHQLETTSEPEAEKRLARYLGDMPEGVSAEGVITRGPLGPLVLRLVEQVSADLLILGSHGWSNEDHASLTERLIERCPCPVLAVQEGEGSKHRFRLTGDEPAEVLVATDFSASGDRAVAYAFELARRLPLRLRLLHVEKFDGATKGDPMAKLHEMVPGDLAKRVECHVATGPAADGILKMAEAWDPEMIVMGEHGGGILRRIFTTDTAKEVLHRAGRAVWYVPKH